MSETVRFRYSAAVPLAGLTGFVALIPLAGSLWYLSPLLLVPVAVLIWGWRSGVDVDPDGLTVRAMLGSRRLPWADVTGFASERDRVYAVLGGDRTVRLPAVTPRDVPRLIECGGQRLAPADRSEPDQSGPAAQGGPTPGRGEPDQGGPTRERGEPDSGDGQ